MKCNAATRLANTGNLFLVLSVSTTAAAIFLTPSISVGQIFVTNNNGDGVNLVGPGYVGKYNLDGTIVNSKLISSGLDGPRGIAVLGSNLLVVNYGFGFGVPIGEYTTSGAVVNQRLTADLFFANGITTSAGNLYVTEFASVGKLAMSGTAVKDPLFGPLASLAQGIAVSGDGTRVFVVGNGNVPIGAKNGNVGVYDATTGSAINANLITELDHPSGIALSGNNLFVANSGNGTIGKYNLDGTPVNPTFITGLSNPLDLAAFGGKLYVVNNGTNSIGEFDAASGAIINAALITGLNDPQGIAIVPEPAALTLIATGTLGLLGFRRRVRQTVNIPGAASPQPIKYKHEITEIANGAKNSDALEIRRPQRAPVSNFLVEEQVFAR